MRARARYRALGVAIVGALVVLVAGCAGDDDAVPHADGSVTSTPTATTPSTAATATAPTPSSSWRDDYSPDELDAYEGALQRWADYDRDAEAIWAAGKATDDAEAVFRAYFVSPVWQQLFARLQTYESSQVTVTGLPTVYWSMPTSIEISDDGDAITIRQCVDYSTQAVEQAGTPVPAIRGPVLRSATLDRSTDSDWLLLRVNEPTVDKFRACTREAP